MALMSAAIVAATLGWFVARTEAGISSAQVQTETFTLLAICEWFNVLNCRSESKSALSFGLFKNRWLLGGLLTANLLQLAVVFWSPLSEVFHTVPIGGREALLLAVVGSSVLWVEELRKLIARQRALRGAT
jgi:Ca2+-transporting ATPase